MKRLSLHWTRSLQVFCCDQECYEQDSAASTDPSHDVAHLIVAAVGTMPWRPAGPRDDVCLAEYNAVLLEHFLDRTFWSVISGSPEPHETLAVAVAHMRWFVEKHFAPFPLSSEEAYRRFCRHVDVDVVARLSPHYFRIKRHEWTTPGFRDEEYQLSFRSDDAPDVDDVSRAALPILRHPLAAVAS
jgi:hypothetical protein